MRASPIIQSTNAGELTPLLDGRTDLAKYAHGARRLENFIPLVHGPATRRAGTRFVQETKDSPNRSFLIKFEYSATQAFVIEFGENYCRFYTNEGALLTGSVSAWATATGYIVTDMVTNGGTTYYCTTPHIANAVFAVDLALGFWVAMTDDIYEIPSPYGLQELENSDGTMALVVEQSGDVLYIANLKRTVPPYKLTRVDTTRWKFTEYQPSNGPFLTRNLTAITIYVDTGPSLIASDDVFAATDVGRLVRVEVQDQTIEPWETNKAYALSDYARYDGKTYIVIDAGTSGTSPPIHNHGQAYDGKGAVGWEYVDSGYGVGRITAYNSPTDVDLDQITDEDSGLRFFPEDVVGAGNATTRWALGAWSETTEYPGALAFFRNRLVWFGTQTIWASVPNDFENMAADFFGEIRNDAAIVATLPGSEVNAILWAAGASRLIIGTPGGEFEMAEITTTDAFGPFNYKIERLSKYRCRAVQPAAVGTSLFYVQRAGRKLLMVDYDIESDGYVSTDVAALSNHITRSGIVATAWQAEPYSVLWCVLTDGGLVGLTYDGQQDVVGWHRHSIGGGVADEALVQSVAVIPSPAGDREQLWMIVFRTIDGVPKRHVEFIEAQFEGADLDGVGGDDQAFDAFYVDSGLTYSGAPATVITGMEHLEGETVQVLADGAVVADKVVSGGQITLTTAASYVHVGLAYTSRYVGMRLEAGGGDGTSQGKIKRIDRMTVRFKDTGGGKVGQFGGRLDDISLRDPGTPMDTPEPIATRDVVVDFPSDYDTDCSIEIRQEQPLPMTIVAIMPRMKAYP